MRKQKTVYSLFALFFTLCLLSCNSSSSHKDQSKPELGRKFFVTDRGFGNRDGSSYEHAMSVSTHNTFVFEPDDTVYLCDLIIEPISLPSSGKENHPIKYRGDYSGHSATINGQFLIDNCIDLNLKDYITFNRLTVKNAASAGILSGSYGDDISQDINIENVSVSDCTNRGIEIRGGVNITISNCNIGNVLATNPHGDGIYVGTDHNNNPSKNIKVLGCTFVGSYGRMAIALTGCDIGQINGNKFSPTSVGLAMIIDLEPNPLQAVKNIDISSNTFDFNLTNIYAISGYQQPEGTLSNLSIAWNRILGHDAGKGIFVSTVNGSCTIENNTIINTINGIRCEYGKTQYGISKNFIIGPSANGYLIQSAHDSSIEATNNILVNGLVGITVAAGCRGVLYNNTICDFSYQGIRAIGEITAINNILSTQDNDHYLIYDDYGFGSYNYNLYYSPNDTLALFFYNGINYDSLTPWKNETNSNINSLQTNPLFISSDNFHLQSLSPAIDAGNDVGIIIDLDGVSIPQGQKPDIGAYEFH